MARRIEIMEVLVPVKIWVQDDEDMREVGNTALAHAKRLALFHGGRVTGLDSIAKAEAHNAERAYRFRFVCEVPEGVALGAN